MQTVAIKTVKVNFYRAGHRLQEYIRRLQTAKKARWEALDAAGSRNATIEQWARAAYVMIRDGGTKAVYEATQDHVAITVAGKIPTTARAYLDKHRLDVIEHPVCGKTLVIFKLIEVDWPDIVDLVVVQYWLQAIKAQAAADTTKAALVFVDLDERLAHKLML